MDKIGNIRTMAGILLFTAVLFTQACSAKKPVAPPLQGHWQETGITVDGSIADWPELRPQFYDKTHRTAIRVMNDEQSVSISVFIGDDSLKRNVAMSGFNLVLAPEGSEGKPFAIRVEGRKPQRMSGPLRLEVTYPHSSGPMRMSQEEAAGYGIELGMSGPDQPHMVVEAKISLDAFLTEPFVPGRKMDLSFRTLTPRPGRHVSGQGKEKQPGSKGGMSGGRPMKGGKGKRTQSKEAMKPYEAKVKILFAGGPVG